ncbi:probable G-protein coupled receptor 141 isoform X4 [Scyliorhinus canicula]|uniref:probable G-protein coupled receptor 141 isoform X4 n=1 Tax=Scyliorhinus canicula TaxID=7830 RepID=UPI0018F33597|nr:probable G-protein coupled receptor 141 isoform X4 [Scyliorhinus canicula]
MNNNEFSTGMFTNNTSNTSLACNPLGASYNAALITIYTIVLIGGSAGAAIMTWKIKTDRKSITSTAVINLISVHTFFLLTLPFRISYYVLGEWKFGEIFYDTKVGGIADSDEDCQRIQQDLDHLETWAERWQMVFNPDKCEVMHPGRSNTDPTPSSTA